MRRSALSAAVALSAVLALAGCSAPTATTTNPPTESEPNVTAQQNAPTQAVLALGGRIVDAVVKPVTDGLGRGLSIEFEVSTADPVSVEELRAVVVAARDASSFDPVTISIVGYVADGGGRTAVDTWTAGNELFDVAGNITGGIVVTELEATRSLGPWGGRR